MTDKIQIIITRGCDADGNGGEVVDSPFVVLGELPDKTLLLDVIIQAFADSYPIAMVDGENPEDPKVPSISMIRNVSYQLRLFINNVVDGWRANKKREAAQAIVQAENEAIAASYMVNG